MNAMQAMERPPLYWQARAHCEEAGLGVEEVEGVRLRLAVAEWNRRCEPWIRMLANTVALMPLPMMPGYMLSGTYLEMERCVRELIEHEARSLGLEIPRRPDAGNNPGDRE
jgi:hypothetical protein